MPACGALHPDHPEVRCEAPEGGHPYHYARPEWAWDDPDYQAQAARTAPRPARDWEDDLLEKARKIRAAQSPPVVREDDPWAAHMGAEMVDPARERFEATCLALFRSRPPMARVGIREFKLLEGAGEDGGRRARALRQPPWYRYIKTVRSITGDTSGDYILMLCPRCSAELRYLEEEKREDGHRIEWSRCVPCAVTYHSAVGSVGLTAF